MLLSGVLFDVAFTLVRRAAGRRQPRPSRIAATSTKSRIAPAWSRGRSPCVHWGFALWGAACCSLFLAAAGTAKPLAGPARAAAAAGLDRGRDLPRPSRPDRTMVGGTNAHGATILPGLSASARLAGLLRPVPRRRTRPSIWSTAHPTRSTRSMPPRSARRLGPQPARPSPGASGPDSYPFACRLTATASTTSR